MSTLVKAPMLGGYTFTQASSSATWTITHNLNTLAPVLDCWISVLGVQTKILPVTVNVIDSTQVQITFSIARAGTAYVV